MLISVHECSSKSYRTCSVIYKSSETILNKKGIKHKKTNTYVGESHVYSIEYIVYFKDKQINTYFQASIQHKKPFLPVRYIFGWSTEILRHPTLKRHNLFVWRVWL